MENVKMLHLFRVEFANNSEARGVLAIFNYVGPKGPDLIHSHYIILDKQTVSHEVALRDLSGGKYKVMVLDVENDGLIKSEKPAYETEYTVPGDEVYGTLPTCGH